ncbi:MAG: hypothetical protein ABI854_12200 [Betaproteobacteria bacterium]
MKYFLVVMTVAALAGCGVETMGTAATAAALKKQELDQGKATMQQFNQKLGQAMQQTEQRTRSADEAANK